MLHADFFELAVPKVAREATRRRMNVLSVKLVQLLEQRAVGLSPLGDGNQDGLPDGWDRRVESLAPSA